MRGCVALWQCRKGRKVVVVLVVVDAQAASVIDEWSGDVWPATKH